MKKRNKRIALIVSLVFVVALSVSFTAAYLTAQTDTVTNTFTATTSLIKADGAFTLTETKNYKMGTEGFELDGVAKTNTGVNYTGVLPGMKIAKDPMVSIDLATAGHIFLKVESTNMTAEDDYANDGDLYNWTIANGWELVEKTASGNGKTYYLYVMRNVSGVDGEGRLVTTNIPVLEGNQVEVANYDVEDADLAEQGASLKFSAYAIQVFGVDVSDEAKALDVFTDNFGNYNA